jgi:hypothetical protein
MDTDRRHFDNQVSLLHSDFISGSRLEESEVILQSMTGPAALATPDQNIF